MEFGFMQLFYAFLLTLFAGFSTSIGAVIAIFYLIYVYDKKKFEDIAYNTTNHEKKVSSKAILRKLLRYALPITLSAGIQNFGGMIDMMNVSRRLIHAGFTQTQSDSLYGLLYNYKVLIGVPLIIVTALTTIVLPAVTTLTVFISVLFELPVSFLSIRLGELVEPLILIKFFNISVDAIQLIHIII